jgi:tripartite-type tricarboxylate transporter receptor subunit TctC
MNRTIRCICAALLAVPSAAALAQAYPTKPVRVIISYPPGGVDVVTRQIMPTIEKELGQPWVLEYRSGAGGVIGHEYTARQPADGYTLVVTLGNSVTVAPGVRKQTPYNPLTDFTYISQGIEPLGLIVAHPSVPVNSLAELVAYAKKNPGKLTWATSGIGSSWHINGELAKLRGDFDVVHAPYQGFGQMIPALLGNQVPLMMITWSVVRPMIQAGKMKVLGITNTEAKLKAIAPPGAQAFDDIFPGYHAIPDWVGLAGPAGIPGPIVQRIHAAYVKGFQQPDIMKKMEEDKQLIVLSSPEEFTARVRREVALVQNAVKTAGIPLQD